MSIDGYADNFKLKSSFQVSGGISYAAHCMGGKIINPDTTLPHHHHFCHPCCSITTSIITSIATPVPPQLSP
jgi:hypothetical protein